MRYIINKDLSTIKRFAKFAKNVWNLSALSDEELAYKGIEAVESLFQGIEIPKTLTELNIDDRFFDRMAEHANEGGRLEKIYVPLTNEDIIKIYKNCL